MRRWWSVLAALVVTGAATPSGAQTFNQNVDMQTFRLAPGANNFLTVAGARVDGNGGFDLGVWANYSAGALTIFNANCPNVDNDQGCSAGSVRSRPVAHLTTLNLIPSITFARRFQLSLDLPVTLALGDAVDPTTFRPVGGDANPQGRTSFALGDPRVELKARIAGEGMRGTGVAISAWGNIPTGQYTGGDQRFVSDGQFSGGARAIVDFRYGHFSAAVNAGAIFRPERVQVLTTTLGTRMLWGAGFGYDITPRIAVLAEVFGSTDFSSSLQSNAVEGDLAARYRAGDFSITLGGGAGLVRGAGAPAARAFAGMVWSPSHIDVDRDGVDDAIDRCPGEAEDRDGFEDYDGCPEADNDGDGIEDANDRCPDEAEDRDQFQDNDGCPDNDNDNDGIPDGFDTCPREPEDRDGDRDNDGCPDNDRDRDGVPDERDACPTDPEEFDGFRDDDGCPDPDNDNDGIPDADDQCSDQPETRNGIDDTDGCPDGADAPPPTPPAAPAPQTVAPTPPPANGALAELAGDRIRISQDINFGTGSDRIVGVASFRVLDAVVAILSGHTEASRVEIQGHTDNVGDANANRALSRRRAEMVRTYLVGHGIAESRLTAVGIGPDRPLESNSTADGRARNRRVEFHVTITR
jgi:outer membrane protein OmpA-like peptidoglycan-associated protein